MSPWDMGTGDRRHMGLFKDVLGHVWDRNHYVPRIFIP